MSDDPAMKLHRAYSMKERTPGHRHIKVYDAETCDRLPYVQALNLDEGWYETAYREPGFPTRMKRNEKGNVLFERVYKPFYIRHTQTNEVAFSEVPVFGTVESC